MIVSTYNQAVRADPCVRPRCALPPNASRPRHQSVRADL